MQSQTQEEPRLSDLDIHLWNESKHYRTYKKMGAHFCKLDGQDGVHFNVWAPNAEFVSLVGDFNEWNRESHPMTRCEDTGTWSAFVPGLKNGANYKYYVRSKVDDYESERADPYAFYSQKRPETASRVWNIDNFGWNDQAWMEKRSELNLYKMPLNIYEVHLGSWMRQEDGSWLTYPEIAQRLAEYAKEMGYTHIELLPVTEHPYDGSWGYQATGYFAPTSRFGTPDDFQSLVDILHQHDIGVILDWVPAHFPMDGHALAYFDGTHLFEHEDPRRGVHPEWGTFIFNYARNEVRNFLASSALFWLDHYHIDGIRVDAVASMLYLDYGREAGEFLPNEHGGRENLDAVSFIQEFNNAIKEYYPHVFTCAEESTSWPKVSRGTEDGGLGFTFKWNMGWMNDTLHVFEKDSIHRKHDHNKLTFGMMYQYSENFMLPLSHDEVVHLKKALLTKMPGDDWQRFANLRLLLGYQIGYPGKKLNFMGAEFGQWGEWNFEEALDWHLLEQEPHRGVQRWVQAINNFYRQEPALYEMDSWPQGFEWMDCDDWERSLLSFVRYPEGKKEGVLFCLNLTPIPQPAYRVGVPWRGQWTYCLSSDEERFGGSGVALKEGDILKSNATECHGQKHSIQLDLPPLGVVIFKSARPEEDVVDTMLSDIREHQSLLAEAAKLEREELFSDRLRSYGVSHALQIAIDGVVAVSARLVSTQRLAVSDADTIGALRSAGIIGSDQFAENLNAMVRFRDLIENRETDEDQVYEILQSRLSDFGDYCDAVTRFLDN
jgi:1,4-alpha-glucan branching enzyme